MNPNVELHMADVSQADVGPPCDRHYGADDPSLVDTSI